MKILVVDDDPDREQSSELFLDFIMIFRYNELVSLGS